jgi:hypothetical protein
MCFSTVVLISGTFPKANSTSQPGRSNRAGANRPSTGCRLKNPGCHPSQNNFHVAQTAEACPHAPRKFDTAPAVYIHLH